MPDTLGGGALRHWPGTASCVTCSPDSASARPGKHRVNIAKVNVDYSGSGSTWGCHESYCATRSATGDLLPRPDPAPGVPDHLLRVPGASIQSRPVWSSQSRRGPTTWWMRVTGSSTNDRGIVHTKNEDLTGGTYNRLHLLCGESLYSQTAAVLKVGHDGSGGGTAGDRAGRSGRLASGTAGHGHEDHRHATRPVGCRSIWPTAPVFRPVGDPGTLPVPDRKRTRGGLATGLGRAIFVACGARPWPVWPRRPTSVCGTLDWAIKHMFFAEADERTGLRRRPDRPVEQIPGPGIHQFGRGENRCPGPRC